MADILLDNEAAPSTPASSKSVLWVDSTSKRAHQTDDTGAHHGILGLTINGTGATGTTLSSVDTYVLGSNIRVPSYGFVVGQLFRWFMSISKTAAGVASATYTFRIGTGGVIGDTAHPAALTAFVAQTAVAASADFMFTLQVRTVSASGVVVAGMTGGTGATGLGQGGFTASGVSATFDNTLATMTGTCFVGISINPGASGVWTVDSCFAELVN